MGTALIAPAASAQPYPSRPIKVVVGFPAGSGADTLVRFFAGKLAQVSRGTVIVDNRPGVAGNIGSNLVATSKPDGYTILMNPASSMAGNPHIYKNMPFDVRKDLIAVASLMRLGFILTIGPNNPAGSVKELTAQLKARDGKATFAYANSSSLAATALYMHEAGITARGVAYKASAQAVGDVTAGQVDFLFTDTTYALGQARQGRVKLLATSAPNRIASAPDIATMKELGFPQSSLAPWWGFYMPAGTPDAIVSQIEKWALEIVAMPDTQEFIKSQGSEALPGGRAATTKLLEESLAEWARIVKLANITPQ
jgi:tripartite-type tricarboxylate transporter receptor subunit TctC